IIHLSDQIVEIVIGFVVIEAGEALDEALELALRHWVKVASKELDRDRRFILPRFVGRPRHDDVRSEEHTSELQSLMRTSYAVFFMTKKNSINTININKS